jgi:hypothetical protein
LYGIEELKKIMDKPFNQHDEEMLLSALESAKSSRRKWEQREEAKRWAEFQLPLTLPAALSKLTKDELKSICTILNIKSVSSLNKQGLIHILVQQLPAAFPNLLMKWDEKRYRIVKEIADGGGGASVTLENRQYDYFKETGFIFTGTYHGKRTLAIPQEVLESFKTMDDASLRETVKRNTECIKLTQGMLRYYGTLSFNELDRQLKQHISDDFRLLDAMDALLEAIPFYHEIRVDVEGFSNGRVFDSKRVKQEHQSRLGVPYYPFTRKQLLKAGEPGFIDRNLHYNHFVDFIQKNYPITREEADGYVEECVHAIQIGQAPSNILEFLGVTLEMDTMEIIGAFMDHIMKLHNSTRQWFLKGHSPDELSEVRNSHGKSDSGAKAEVIDFATRKKVSRNDPCPCGSGKKFKKCCGS